MVIKSQRKKTTEDEGKRAALRCSVKTLTRVRPRQAAKCRERPTTEPESFCCKRGGGFPDPQTGSKQLFVQTLLSTWCRYDNLTASVHLGASLTYQTRLIVTIPRRNGRKKEPSETRQQPHVKHSYSNKRDRLFGAFVCGAALLEGEGRRRRSTQNRFARQTEDVQTDHRKKDDQLVELRQQHEWRCNVSRQTDHNRTDKEKGVGPYFSY